MREKLKNRYGKRDRFRGSFVRFGKKSGYKDWATTVLLVNIKDAEGAELSDHLWFNYTKEFSRLCCEGKLTLGVIVEFNARVAVYEKGYMGDGREFGEIDYKMSFPRKLEIVGFDESVAKVPGIEVNPPYECERRANERARWCTTCHFFSAPQTSSPDKGACECPEIVAWMVQHSFPDRVPLQNKACIVLNEYPERCHFKQWKANFVTADQQDQNVACSSSRRSQTNITDYFPKNIKETPKQ